MCGVWVSSLEDLQTMISRSWENNLLKGMSYFAQCIAFGDLIRFIYLGFVETILIRYAKVS